MDAYAVTLEVVTACKILVLYDQVFKVMDCAEYETGDAEMVVNVAAPAPSAVSTWPVVAAPELIAEVPTAAAAIFAATTALEARAAESTAPAAISPKTTALAAICADPTAPVAICVDPTEFALKWLESMLPATIETVEVPDAVDTEAGEVPMTALT